MARFVQVTTTTGTKADAQAIASAVVEKRLAACAQVVGPITSTYWWQGKIETAEEWLCVIKSKETLHEELERAIREIHPYEEPEIIATPIVKGSKGYLDWLDENTK
jgi:periplasmic divalent cation tolerance protein